MVNKYKNKYLILCTENYTSKACTNCGHIKQNLGGNKIYKCKKCKSVIDRDINGARNIYIKTSLDCKYNLAS